MQAGLLPDQFWDLSWREFDMIVRHKNNAVIHDWDVARTLGSWSIAPHTKRKIKPTDLLKLPTDNVRKRPLPTRQEFEALVKQIEHGRHPNV